MPRLIFLLALAALEATLVSVPLLALTSLDVAWPWLFGLVLLGRFADAASLRFPARRERPMLVGAAVAGALALVTQHLGIGLIAALVGLFPSGPQFLAIYALTLVALFLFWRGTRLDTRDSAAISALFGRGVGVIFFALIAGPLVRAGAFPGGPLAAQVVGFISLGLLALALGHANDEGELRGRRLTWRWLLALGLAIGLVVLVGGLLTALLGGGEALAVAQGLIRLVLLPFAIIGATLAWVFITFFAGPLAALIQAILARLRFTPIEPPPTGDAALTDAEGWLDPGMIERMAEQLTFLMALIPIALLIVALLVLRRRARPRAEEEERESLGLFDSLGSDLRDLLGRIANPFARPVHGLRAALAGLRGDDPTTRVRRAYVRLLLRLEARRQTRADSQTPAEFAPAAAVATAAPGPIGDLTDAYEAARYNPAGADVGAAERAERALGQIRE